MPKINLALLAGGNSSEREISLFGAAEVLAALDKAKYNITQYDPKTDLARLVSNAADIDVALIIMHGAQGEDGRIQGLLDLLNIPYQGSGVLGSAVAMHKLAAKHLYAQAALPGARYRVIYKNMPNACVNLEKELGLPLVIKPASAGSSVGVTIVQNAADIEAALNYAFAEDSCVLVEEYIKGVEITVGVLGNETLEALPVVEIVPHPQYLFFDYEAKYKSGATDEICPARISPELALRAQELAKTAHRVLFCKNYSRSDMIIREHDIYLLETNTIPGMTANSLLPKAAKAAGIEFSALLDRLVELALAKGSAA